MRFFYSLILCILCAHTDQVIAKKNSGNYYVVASPPYERGFFSVMDHVFGNIDLYLENPCYQKKYHGITVNFCTQGLYYDATIGKNWWSYYFNPLVIGSTEGRAVCLKRMLNKGSAFHLERNMTTEQVHHLISDHLVLKEDISNYIHDFIQTSFGEYTIGIHYRGTDKITEAPRVKYEKIKALVDEKISELKSSYKIFVATDEQQFLEFMYENYPEEIIFVDGVNRSTDHLPIHKNQESPYYSGYYALIDCVLLSRTDLLIRTSSNLSRWSIYFNPKIDVIELSKRY